MGAALAQMVLDRVHDRVQIVVHVVVSEPQYEISFFAENGVAMRVPKDVPGFTMLASVELDDKLRAMFREIQEI